MAAQQNNWLSLASADLNVRIDPLGAQLSVLADARGRDLLWNGDAAVWSGRAPLLFPIVGELAGGIYRLNTASYAMSRHGFARGRSFEVIESSAQAALFRLKADEASLKIYPFAFELDVHYALEGATLSLTTSVRNLGAMDMPASLGYHPGFCWPLPYGRPRSEHYIEFADDEPDPARRLDAKGLLTPERLPTPIERRRLALEDALFRNDVLIFDAVRSRSVTYGAADGPRIRVSFPDTPYLGFWTKPGAGFICIEPWHGIADPQDYTGDFQNKPGIFTVKPGAHRAIRMAISLLN